MSQSYPGSTPVPGLLPLNSRPPVALGVVVGLVVGIVGGLLWGTVVGLSHWQIGILAVGIGAVVGLSMVRFASGQAWLPIAAAVISVASCMLGDYVATLILIAKEYDAGFGAMLQVAFDPTFASEAFRVGFSPMDLLFWAIAGWAAFQQVRRANATAAASAHQTAFAQGAAVVPGAGFAPEAGLTPEPGLAPGATIVPGAPIATGAPVVPGAPVATEVPRPATPQD